MTQADTKATEPNWTMWLAGLVPLLVYAWSAGAHSYWLDSAEFTAAAVDLDIAHPPGHPVAALWARAFCLLPLGPLPFRVALAQAVAGAVACAALQRAFARTLRALALSEVLTRACFSLGLTWVLAFSYGFWFQAVRAEVYALQAMLICLATERLIAFAERSGAIDERPLYTACFWLGLGLGNHHFMSVLAMPALAWAFISAWRARGARVLAWCLTSGSVGLVSYLYLPLRALSKPAMDLGHPASWKSFWWVVSAQVYARRIGTQATQPMDERFADLAVILVEQFSYATLPLALLGAYAALRTRRTWAVMFVWASHAVIALCGRAWLNPVRNNPDVLGYMLPGFAGYLVLVASALLLAVGALRSARWRRRLHATLSALAAALALVQLLRTRETASLAPFTASDSFDRARLAALPPDAVFIVTSPETTFRHWEDSAVERARPDVDLVPTAFVNYGAVADVWLGKRPELTPVIRSFQAAGTLSSAMVRTLSRARPVLVELDLTASHTLLPWLVPEGMLYRVLEEPPDAQRVRAASDLREQTLAELTRALGAQIEQSETRRQLVWLHFMDALYYASHRQPALALRSVERGLKLQPEEEELLRLQQVLQREPAAFDLQSFRPRL